MDAGAEQQGGGISLAPSPEARMEGSREGPPGRRLSWRSTNERSLDVDDGESSGTGCQVFGIPVGLMVLVLLAILANLALSTSRRPARVRR
jgi:hypothetical protein